VRREFSKHVTNGHHIVYHSELAFHCILGKTESRKLDMYVLINPTESTITKM